MSHDFHEQLPGYHPDQILVDGCGECEARAKYSDLGISSLDPENFARAWQRAKERQKHGLASCSEAEDKLLDVLSAIQGQLEQRGAFIASGTS